jgi:hypothetical protein
MVRMNALVRKEGHRCKAQREGAVTGNPEAGVSKNAGHSQKMVYFYIFWEIGNER